MTEISGEPLLAISPVFMRRSGNDATDRTGHSGIGKLGDGTVITRLGRIHLSLGTADGFALAHLTQRLQMTLRSLQLTLRLNHCDLGFVHQPLCQGAFSLQADAIVVQLLGCVECLLSGLYVGFGLGSVFRNGRARQGLIGCLRLLVELFGFFDGAGQIRALELGDQLSGPNMIAPIHQHAFDGRADLWCDIGLVDGVKNRIRRDHVIDSPAHGRFHHDVSRGAVSGAGRALLFRQ